MQVGHDTRRYNATIQGDTMPLSKAVNGSANQNQLFVPDGQKAVNGSANQNLSNSFMKSELNIMHGERRGIHVIQHNTNEPKTGEKP